MTRAKIDPFCCLIIEDQGLIALSIKRYLEEAGLTVHWVSSLAQARAWLEANSANIAIVDLALENESVSEIAGALKEREIPFIIYSGYPLNRSVGPPKLQAGPWVKAPTSEDVLLKVVLKILLAV